MLRHPLCRTCSPFFAVLVLASSGCSPKREADPKQPLRIAAASDLQSALPRLTERFQARTGIEATPVFGASGRLSEQIRQGAPFDVFLAANERFVRELASEGAIKPDSVRLYARGTLVLAVYHDMSDHVRTLEDLTKSEVKKIGLASPQTAPYGMAGKQALERAGLWEKLQPKIVFADSVRQALMHVQRGDVEAAFVGRAIAAVPEIRPVEVDPSLYDPIIQALGIVAATRRPDAAGQFARFVIDEEGQGILKEFGFAPPTQERPIEPARSRPETARSATPEP
jgi:molybdate transport system substrate-binding protein